MNTPQDMPSRKNVARQVSSGTKAGSGQRFGRITGRQPPGSGSGGSAGVYFVRDDETGGTCSCSSADIVTEGFRAIRDGERVRFLTDTADLSHAIYVIRLDLPDVEEYYK
jgi:hypothetical protein